MNSSKKILICGYTYTDSTTLKTFDHYPSEDSLYFLLPESWPFRGGEDVLWAKTESNIKTARAFFTHSHYPIIGGLLKGWMPVFPLVVFQQKPDLVFSASEPNTLTTLYQGIFTKLCGARYIIHTWENVPFDAKFKGITGAIKKMIITLNLWLCDGITCGTRKAEYIIQEWTGKPTMVTPMWGIDADFFQPVRLNKNLQDNNHRDAVTFTFIGVIAYRKGVHLIVQAFETLSRTMANIRLVLAGNNEGAYAKEISSMIESAGLESLVTRIPFLNREGVRELLNNTDIFLYPSFPHDGWEEQFGFSLTEASLMEVPVITTRSGSISEVVIDGESGILVEPNDAIALERAMRILADDPGKRVSMGKRGRQFMQDSYSRQIVAHKFYDFFHRI